MCTLRCLTRRLDTTRPTAHPRGIWQRSSGASPPLRVLPSRHPSSPRMTPHLPKACPYPPLTYIPTYTLCGHSRQTGAPTAAASSSGWRDSCFQHVRAGVGRRHATSNAAAVGPTTPTPHPPPLLLPHNAVMSLSTPRRSRSCVYSPCLSPQISPHEFLFRVSIVCE